jgi:peptidyl-prolyl cis-trans isomerase D
MISFLIKHKKSILIVTLAFFLGSIVYLGLDAYSRTNYSLIAAKVGNATISMRDLDRTTQNAAQTLRNQGMDLDEETLKGLRQQMLQTLIGEEVVTQAARKADLHVSDYEVASAIAAVPYFTANGHFDKNIYTYGLKRMGLTPAEFEEQIRRSSLGNNFRRLLASNYKMTPKEIEQSYKVQHGNLDKFGEDKKDFADQLLETKMGAAAKAFEEQFNNNIEIKTFLKD